MPINSNTYLTRNGGKDWLTSPTWIGKAGHFRAKKKTAQKLWKGYKTLPNSVSKILCKSSNIKTKKQENPNMSRKKKYERLQCGSFWFKDFKNAK